MMEYEATLGQTFHLYSYESDIDGLAALSVA